MFIRPQLLQPAGRLID